MWETTGDKLSYATHTCIYAYNTVKWILKLNISHHGVILWKKKNLSYQILRWYLYNISNFCYQIRNSCQFLCFQNREGYLLYGVVQKTRIATRYWDYCRIEQHLTVCEAVSFLGTAARGERSPESSWIWGPLPCRTGRRRNPADHTTPL